MIRKWLRSGLSPPIRGLSGLLLAIIIGPALGLDLFSPAIYAMSPEQTEQLRSSLGTIGVVVSPRAGKQKVLMPAKGPGGGFARGLAAGASFPVAVGFVSPVPGGTLLGILVAPFTAVAGAFYGAITAPSAGQIEAAEKEIQLAEESLRAMELERVLMDRLVALGSDNTPFSFVPLLGVEPPDLSDDAGYRGKELSGVTTVLEVRSRKAGLRGLYGINPQTSVFIELNARLIRVRDNDILLTESPSCGSEGRREYVEWAVQEGELIVDEITTCVDELAEKIIDDFFLVYPTQSP